MSAYETTTFVLTAIVAGIAGCAAMELVMGMISRAQWAKGSMIVALGSLLTRNKENAFRVGVIIHGFSAISFAIIYTLIMMGTGFTGMPGSLALGLGIGFFHGMLVSLSLVWVVADRHPLEEFKGADLAIGLSHLVGHVAFGAAVGLVVGLSPL